MATSKAMKTSVKPVAAVNLQQSTAKATHHSFTTSQDSLPPEPQPPLEYALSTLKHELANLSSSTENLYSTLEPFLPRHLFEDSGNSGSAVDDALYPEHDSNLSPTVLEVYKALNEVMRLQRRLNFINAQVIR